MVHPEHSSGRGDLESRTLVTEVSAQPNDTSESVQSLLKAPLLHLQLFLDSHEKTLSELKDRLASSPLSIDLVPVDAQLHALQRFLDSHLKNIQALRNVSTSGPGTDQVKDNTTIANQLNVIILTATFTSGVLVAFMSLMNDVLNGMEVGLFHDDKYTPYSLGIIFGLLAIGVNLGIAVVAAVNVALASYYTSNSNQRVKLQSRVLLCTCGQFVAAALSGVALILLSLHFDWAAAAMIGAIYLGCMAMSIYFIQQPWNWKEDLLQAPLTIASLVFSTATFAVAVAELNIDSWFIIPAFVLTLLYHIMMLIPKPQEPWKIITPAIFLCMLWAACIALALYIFALGPSIIAQCVGASIEVIVMAVLAFQAFRGSRRFSRR